MIRVFHLLIAHYHLPKQIPGLLLWIAHNYSGPGETPLHAMFSAFRNAQTMNDE